MEFREPGFETLVRSIVYQQLSGKVAKVIFDRLNAATGTMTPEAVLKLRPERMRRTSPPSRRPALPAWASSIRPCCWCGYPVARRTWTLTT